MWPNPQFPVDLVTFTDETLMENFIFCAVILKFVPQCCPYYINSLSLWPKQAKNIRKPLIRDTLFFLYQHLKEDKTIIQSKNTEKETI